MKLKEKVLSNIIQYVTENVVNTPIEQLIEQEDLTYNSYRFNELDPSFIWKDLTEFFDFDEVSLYLLNNFKNAIDSENYLAASNMKKEILNHWSVDNKFFYETGFIILDILNEGVNNSKLLNHLSTEVEDVIFSWNTNGLKEINFINETLESIEEYINTYYPQEDLKNEVITSLSTFNDSVTHPLIHISKVVQFFKFFK
jgi:hypothetical protein